MFTKIGTITLGVSDQDKALGGILTRRVGTANGTSPATYFIEVAQQLLAWSSAYARPQGHFGQASECSVVPRA